MRPCSATSGVSGSEPPVLGWPAGGSGWVRPSSSASCSVYVRIGTTPCSATPTSTSSRPSRTRGSARLGPSGTLASGGGPVAGGRASRGGALLARGLVLREGPVQAVAHRDHHRRPEEGPGERAAAGAGGAQLAG